MGKRVNPTAIGAFVIGALVLTIIAIVMIGSGRFFQRTQDYVLFFKGSVNGLGEGAAVKFRGVQIGVVKEIRLSLDIPEIPVAQEVPTDIQIPVVIELNSTMLSKNGVRNLNLADPAGIRAAVKNGLRGQLEMESFVTGVLYVDLDMQPGSPANFVLPPNTGWVEIPTSPTTLEQAQSVATELLDKLRKIDFDKFLNDFNRSVDAITAVVTSPKLQETMANLAKASAELSTTAVSFRQLADNLNSRTGPLARSLNETSQNANVTMVKAQEALESVQETFDPASPLTYQLNQTLVQIGEAARSMRELADYLQRNPSSVIRGRSYVQDSQ
ncbi:MAG TPA: MlaD family protein [Candidatus Binataceae bacterium]|nr:MlaD family protein [Candidatus Binataceae bacterium]